MVCHSGRVLGNPDTVRGTWLFSTWNGEPPRARTCVDPPTLPVAQVRVNDRKPHAPVVPMTGGAPRSARPRPSGLALSCRSAWTCRQPGRRCRVGPGWKAQPQGARCGSGGRAIWRSSGSCSPLGALLLRLGPGAGGGSGPAGGGTRLARIRPSADARALATTHLLSGSGLDLGGVALAGLLRRWAASEADGDPRPPSGHRVCLCD